jgi:hypothetical protein
VKANTCQLIEISRKRGLSGGLIAISSLISQTLNASPTTPLTI